MYTTTNNLQIEKLRPFCLSIVLLSKCVTLTQIFLAILLSQFRHHYCRCENKWTSTSHLLVPHCKQSIISQTSPFSIQKHRAKVERFWLQEFFHLCENCFQCIYIKIKSETNDMPQTVHLHSSILLFQYAFHDGSPPQTVSFMREFLRHCSMFLFVRSFSKLLIIMSNCVHPENWTKQIHRMFVYSICVDCSATFGACNRQNSIPLSSFRYHAHAVSPSIVKRAQIVCFLFFTFFFLRVFFRPSILMTSFVQFFIIHHVDQPKLLHV